MNALKVSMVLLGIAVAAPAAADTSLDVSPIRFHLHVQPGGEHTDAVRVLNTGEEPTRIRAYVEDWYLDEAGTPIFQPVGTQGKTSSPWIELAPSDFLVQKAEEEVVRFTVRVPEGTPPGGYHGALLLETLPLNRASSEVRQMFIQGRVACIVYVTVGEPVKSLEITAMETVNRKGTPLLRMQVQNTGLDFVRLAGDVVCLADGERIDETITVPDVPVLPGASRWVELALPTLAAADNIMARARLDIEGIGTLVGECRVDPELTERATLVD